MSRPATAVSSNSSAGQTPGRVVVAPSACSSSGPGGAPGMVNWPWASLSAESAVPSIERVTPGTGISLLSSTTPLTRVAAGSPGTLPVATKVTGRPTRPAKAAATSLLSKPSSGPRVSRTTARPLASLSTVTALRPLKLPPPETTVKVTGTAARRLWPASVTTATKGRVSGWPAAPV